MKPQTNAKLREACADLAKEITPHLSGFAPYTPVTVSSHTFPYQAPDRDGGSVSNSLDGALLIHVDSDTGAVKPLAKIIGEQDEAEAQMQAYHQDKMREQHA